MKLYCLNYDSDGDRESWSVFYTPLEVFDTKEKRNIRKTQLRNFWDHMSENDEGYDDMEFNEFEIELNDISSNSYIQELKDIDSDPKEFFDEEQIKNYERNNG